MSNVLIAIAVLVIGFVLASYGVYENVQASRRTAMATTIGSKMNRLAIVNQEQREDVGHILLAPSQEAGTGFAYYSLDTLSRENFGPVTFRYHFNGTDYFVCATSTDTGPTMLEALRMVARDRPPTYVSGECGNAGVAIGAGNPANVVVVSMKIY